MAVTVSRAGTIATVTVTVDAGDLVARTDLTAAQKRSEAVARALQHLADAVAAGARSDAEIDAAVGDAQLYAARLKTARSTGTV